MELTNIDGNWYEIVDRTEAKGLVSNGKWFEGWEMTPLEQFIKNVKVGKVPGIVVCEGLLVDQKTGSLCSALKSEIAFAAEDWICAAIRRALTAMGFITRYQLTPEAFWIYSPRFSDKCFSVGTELDWHLAAINYAVDGDQ